METETSLGSQVVPAGMKMAGRERWIVAAIFTRRTLLPRMAVAAAAGTSLARPARPARAARPVTTTPMGDADSDEFSDAGEGPLRCEKCEADFDADSLRECALCNELYCQDCLECEPLGEEISCSGYRNEGNDSADGEFESDRVATDAERDHGSVSGKSKRRRKESNGLPCTSSPRESLVVPKDDEQAELMSRLYRNAREMERQLKDDNKRINETRNLTLLDLTDAASCLYGGEPNSKDIRRKLEKEDYGLYSITVRQAGASGETILGTTKKGRTGEVVEAKMKEGYNVFTIEWSDGKGNARSAYTTLEVLCYRDDGQGVVSLDEANACMRVFLLAALCMVNTQVHQFIDNDSKVENVKYLCTLPDGQKGGNIKAGRQYAWDEMEKASVKAMDMLMDKEKQFLKSSEDEGLLAEMEKSSCFQMMGLDAYNRIRGLVGLVDSEEDFNPKSLAFVNHFVRGAQASFRLGRATNFAASTIHLSVNELLPEST